MLPTFAYLAGLPAINGIDGQNIWNTLSLNLESPRNDILGHLDTIDPQYATYMSSQWKYINGTTYNGLVDVWSGAIDSKEIHESMLTYGVAVLTSVTGQALASFGAPLNVSGINNFRSEAEIQCPTKSNQMQCDLLRAPCLFNIWEDPCERYNVIEEYPEVAEYMEEQISHFRKIAVQARNKVTDTRADPSQFNETWTWWYDELGLNDNGESKASWIGAGNGLISFLCLIIAINWLSYY